MGVHTHKRQAPRSIRAAVLTASSSRDLDADKSGHWIRKELLREGHEVVCHAVVPDDAIRIQVALKKAVADQQAQVVVINGGTGISPYDVTIEAVQPLISKQLTAFGTLFAQLSFEQIDSAAIMSRATAGVIENRAVVFCVPGSIKACKLACRELILPELGHIVKHLQEPSTGPAAG